MIIRILIFLLGIFFIPSLSFDMQISSKPLTELIDKSDYIALVLIERGEILSIESELNAAIYSARVGITALGRATQSA